MIAPKISGEMIPPILNPVVTKPNTLPKEPGGVTSRTIMSRDGMMMPEKSPIKDITRDQHHRAKINLGDQGGEDAHGGKPDGCDQTVPRGAANEQTAQQYADCRPQQIAGQRRIGRRDRSAIERAECDHRIIVKPRAYHREQHEENEIEQDRRRQSAAAIRRGVVGAGACRGGFRLNGRWDRESRAKLPPRRYRGLPRR